LRQLAGPSSAHDLRRTGAHVSCRRQSRHRRTLFSVTSSVASPGRSWRILRR
jgi:hypothetical protein